MLFQNIKPYVRFARYLTVYNNSDYPSFTPYDARLFYVIEGSAKILADGKSYIMEKGSFILINSGVDYRLCNPEKKVIYLAINFDYTFENSNLKTPIAPDKSENFIKSKLVSKSVFSDLSSFDTVVYIKDFSATEKELIKIEYEYARKIHMYELYTCSLLSEVLTRCARRIHMDTYYLSNNEKTDKILNYIHENYNENISNEYLGKLFGFHPNYISSQIKSYTGMSLHKYLLHVRLLHAVDMLEHKKYSIGEIAEKCGFCDIYYFSSYFKKEFGVSPSKYKGI